MRFIDLEIVIEVVKETKTSERPRGARAEIAKRRGIARSIVTEAIGRIEVEMEASFFEPNSLTLTPSGEALAHHGPRFIESQQIFLNL